MRLKILFPPFALVIAVILIIWFVWPEFGDLRTIIQEFQAKQETLKEVRAKEANVKSLISTLGQNSDQENFVLNYLSSKRNEEKIINALNFLATSYQLNLVNVNVEKIKSTAEVPTSVQTLLDDTAGNVSEVASNVREIQYVATKINVSGTYDQITKFINAVSKMEFLNKIDSIKISVQPAQAATPEQPQSLAQGLSCEMTVEFGYLSPISSGTDFSTPVFSQSGFNFEKVNGLVQSLSEKAPVLDEGMKGLANPFFP
jgi:hypothetical protein